MVKTFTFVNAEAGHANRVYQGLKRVAKKIDAEVYGLFGEYDFLVISDSQNLKGATKKIVQDIQNIEGVWTTRTLVEAEFD
ncbi:MAG: Lrp/AsnC family transcriptional regulator [Euryarchaeota archaeon]|nr:Lrp/AsnC family transcriptional regulator [Euryarchaeota archaeon]